MSEPAPIETSYRRPGPKPGRVCAQRGCKTLLSAYNKADTCSIHGGWPAEPEVTMVHSVEDLYELMTSHD